jgi:hypothetical protein
MHNLMCIAMSVCDSLLLGYQDSLFTRRIYNIDSRRGCLSKGGGIIRPPRSARDVPILQTSTINFVELRKTGERYYSGDVSCSTRSARIASFT